MLEIEEYWTRRVEIGRLPLLGEGEQDVALIWHQAQENCGRGHHEYDLGVMKDNTKRVYVHARACYFVPGIIVTDGIAEPPAWLGQQVGVVEDVRPRGSRRVEVANLHSWYYPDAGALMLWEVDIWRHPEADPRKDFILAVLFDGFERELLRVFPNARQVISPHEPNYPSEQWAEFLLERGYEMWRENMYRKAIAKTDVAVRSAHC